MFVLLLFTVTTDPLIGGASNCVCCSCWHIIDEGIIRAVGDVPVMGVEVDNGDVKSRVNNSSSGGGKRWVVVNGGVDDFGDRSCVGEIFDGDGWKVGTCTLGDDFEGSGSIPAS